MTQVCSQYSQIVWVSVPYGAMLTRATCLQMRSNPMAERVQRLGCYSLAEVSYRNWNYTMKAATARCSELT